MSHIAVTITCAPGLTDVLIAQLSDAGYEGFEEKTGQLIAYIPAGQFDEAALVALLPPSGTTFTKEEIRPVNWNALWESNFEPVLVGSFCGIRAGFHPPFAPAPEHEIVITPKMSFGTGHHATTFSMIQLMQQQDLAGRKVFDFGTGTGILAILAARMGAAQVDAIDIDDWAVENSRENIAGNNVPQVCIWQADSLQDITGLYDVVLANINRNVLLQSMPDMRRLLAPGGQLLLSGILVADEPEILDSAAAQGLLKQRRVEKDNWLALSLLTR
ncbi:50S ribosomal protein L11 methyltransferase [Chitinophaga japonensis]|uniref:Ribosomal protein L11 methyltransferase n=1 Tax=Chitinophaga japonensis TaxID=104662 RepID=A0A562SL83_CHIJA|nr:50S ribosomal protein L11 methyltransferase [Chitinophaga japonensis]TWI82059.1 ribosomal protein L11 methyltransferase [Chitinophaga japonensis]